MGQKVHPVGIRLGIVKEHNSLWYAGPKSYSDCLVTDLQVREFLFKRLKNASVSRIKIERPSENVRITIATARPGIVIGKKGEDVERLRRDVAAKMGVPVHINIEEVRKPDLDARLVGDNVAGQLERRVMFRRAMKRAVQNAMKSALKVSRFSCWSSVVQRLCAMNGTAKAECRCTPVPTSITQAYVLKPLTAPSVSRCGSSVAKCLVAWSRFSRKSSRSSPRARRSAAAVKG